MRQGGTLANRDSNWPRDHLTQRDRAALIKPNNMERVLADFDADYGDCSLECLSPGGARARPDHHTTGRAASLRSLRGQVRAAPTEQCSCENVGRNGADRPFLARSSKPPRRSQLGRMIRPITAWPHDQNEICLWRASPPHRFTGS